MKTYKIIPYRTFAKGLEYFEESEINDIKQKIIEDGGIPVISEDSFSIQIDGKFKK